MAAKGHEVNENCIRHTADPRRENAVENHVMLATRQACGTVGSK